jgi:hypothetical protein
MKSMDKTTSSKVMTQPINNNKVNVTQDYISNANNGSQSRERQ